MLIIVDVDSIIGSVGIGGDCSGGYGKFVVVVGGGNGKSFLLFWDVVRLVIYCFEYSLFKF